MTKDTIEEDKAKIISRSVHIQRFDIEVSIASEDPNESIEHLMNKAIYIIDKYKTSRTSTECG